MEEFKKKGYYPAGGRAQTSSAGSITYINTNSGLSAGNVQDAIDEVNEKSTGLEIKTLLWTNEDTTVEFDAQTISLDLSDYDEVEILYKAYTTGTYYEFIKVAKGLNCVLHTLTDASVNAQRLGSRIATFNDGGVTFNDAYLAVAGGSTSLGVYNNNIIPYRIYGIRKVV